MGSRDIRGFKGYYRFKILGFREISGFSRNIIVLRDIRVFQGYYGFKRYQGFQGILGFQEISGVSRDIRGF